MEFPINSKGNPPNNLPEAFPAGSGEEILRRIRFSGQKSGIPEPRDQKLRKPTSEISKEIALKPFKRVI